MRKSEYKRSYLTMMSIFLMLFFSAFTNYCSGQVKNKEWSLLNFGSYKVGYRDTIIYDTTENYSFKNLNTIKPYFIHIWYPCKVTPKASLSFYYKDYWKFEKDSINNEIISNLIKI